MKFTQMSMLVNSIISMWMNHPISLGATLMMQSILTSLNLILLTKNSWYSMILFITFSSGLMIMFMYMSSITSNEKFKLSMKMFVMLTTLILTTWMMSPDMILMFKTKWMEKMIWLQENEEKKTFTKILSSNKIYMLSAATILILIVLMSISNLISSFEGPLKSTYELY